MATRITRPKIGKPAARAGKRARSMAAVVMEEACHAGLLDGGRTERLSFRAPKALIEAAKRESGAATPTELGLLALATLAQADPTANFLRKTRGRLGPEHRLHI